MVRVVRELMRLVLRRMLMVLVLLVLMLVLKLLVLVLRLLMRVVRIRALRQVHRAGGCAATTFAVSRPEEMASNSCVIPGRDLLCQRANGWRLWLWCTRARAAVVSPAGNKLTGSAAAQ